MLTSALKNINLYTLQVGSFVDCVRKFSSINKKISYHKPVTGFFGQVKGMVNWSSCKTYPLV